MVDNNGNGASAPTERADGKRLIEILARKGRETDLEMAVAAAPNPDAPIEAKKPRARGRKRAEIAAKPVVIVGPTSRRRPKLGPGVKLVRVFKGTRHVVLVLDENKFEWNGQVWRSLSGIANAISGSHVSGPRFFGIVKPKKDKTKS